MGLVEDVRNLRNNVVGENRITDRQNEINAIVRQFLGGGIDAETQHATLLDISVRYNDIPRVTLEYPGPLYGLLRLGAGWDIPTSREKTDEERAHFEASRKTGFDPFISIEVESKRNEVGELELLYWVFVVSLLSPEIEDENRLRDNLANVFTAPDAMSADDLAKLSHNEILFDNQESIKLQDTKRETG